MENKVEKKDLISNNANRLLSAGFTPIAEMKPNERNPDGSRAWVWVAWSNNANQPLKVFADKIGTEHCSADYWKPL